jgi:hypothetical protein
MILKRPKHKQFEYIPRYYDPDTDPELKRRERFKFRSSVRRGRKPAFVRLVIWLIAAMVVYFLLAG